MEFFSLVLNTDFLVLEREGERQGDNVMLNVIMGIFHAPFKLIYVIECEQWAQPRKMKRANSMIFRIVLLINFFSAAFTASLFSRRWLNFFSSFFIN